MNKNDELKQLVDDVVGVKPNTLEQLEDIVKYFSDDLGNPLQIVVVEEEEVEEEPITQPWEELSKIPPQQTYILRYSSSSPFSSHMDFIVCRWLASLNYYQDVASFVQRSDAEEYIQFLNNKDKKSI